MKTTKIMLFAALLAGSLATTSQAATSVGAGIHVGPSGRASVDIGFFYDDLAPYGNWIERPSRGWVWTPRDVASDWRPYEDGHWVWTDDGWTWITDEPYGWATYHYGRWYDDPEVGWAWVPDDEWAPAWVSWQEGGDYIGWAPLPPAVDVRVSFGSYGLSPAAYLFVPERYFLAPRLSAYYVPRQRIDPIFRQSRNITRYRFAGNRIYNDGLAFDRVQRVVGRPVPRYQLGDLTAAQRRSGARIAGNRVEVFRPQVERVRVAAPPDRPVARRAVVSAAQFRAAHPARRQAVQAKQTAPPRQRVAPRGRPDRPDLTPKVRKAPAVRAKPARPPHQVAPKARPARPQQVQRKAPRARPQQARPQQPRQNAPQTRQHRQQPKQHPPKQHPPKQHKPHHG